MAAQGHGDHWECLGNLDESIQKILPKVLQESDTVEKGVEWVYSERKEYDKHTAYSLSINAELSALAVCIASEKKQTSNFASAYPFVQSENYIKLKITEIHEWDNLVEGIIEGETEDGHTLSFFDTKYFKNKEAYQIGKTYPFSICALGYNVEILKEKSFSFEGQKAVDWLAKIGNKPDYDEHGNVKPVVFDLSNLVSFFPRSEYPDDAEFQSPINKVDIVKAFDNEFYKINITIFRDPDICIDLYAKTNFFDNKPAIDEPLRGVIWVQGCLAENTVKQQSRLLNSDGEPIIN